METKNEKKTENTGSKVQSAVSPQRPSISNPAKENKNETVKAEAKQNDVVKKADAPKTQEQPKQETALPSDAPSHGVTSTGP